MKKTLLTALIFFCVLFNSHAQNCGDVYTDSGGINGNYAGNTHTVTTISPDVPGQFVRVDFILFEIENPYDVLKIYDGPDIDSPLLGTFTGSNSPGEFVSTHPTGSLTFKFDSDPSVQKQGWVANVTCSALPVCFKPTALTYVYANESTINLSWTENGTATQWEVIALPIGQPAPTDTTEGTIVNTNPAFVPGTVLGNGYDFYVRSICGSEKSPWNIAPLSMPIIYLQPANDECSGAIPLDVNSGTICNNATFATMRASTASPGAVCAGTLGQDIWFSFTALESQHQVDISYLNPSMAIYSGTCGDLTQVACTQGLASTLHYAGFIPGQTYYIRIWNFDGSMSNANFSVCVKSVSVCQNSESFCGSTPEDPYIFPNTVGLPAQDVWIGCLLSTPNPTYFTLKVTQSGPLVFNIMQNRSFDASGNPTGGAMDVDYVAWGPFTSSDNCSQIDLTQCNGCNYPSGNIVGCSYSSSATETLSIPNAIVGEYYKVLITNYSNSRGFIKLAQTNYLTTGSGRTSCADKIQLVAFADLNNNGVKSANEPFFTNGTFRYERNNSGIVNIITAPLGRYSVYDSNPGNTYDFSYQVNPEYATYCTATATNFNALNIPYDSGTQILYFPISVAQNFNDVSVAISPLQAPVAGMPYRVKVSYSNLGVIPVSGGLAFTKDTVMTAITTDVTTTPTPTGFTYNFNNLAPGETRAIIVTMQVPPIPGVNIGDSMTSSVSVTIPSGDINLNNNTFSSTRTIVASYDPNDKMESHGSQILATEFDADDYLNYTIRFQNTGNSNAINVRLVDILDAGLDATTIRVIGASHPYTMEIVNNRVVWKFDNIQLLPAVLDETASQGFVTFKIKPTPGSSDGGDTIPNSASIYFDSNPAIVTNTFMTEFLHPLHVQQFSANNIVVFPNPAKDSFEIRLQHTTENMQQITIYDLLGKAVKKYAPVHAPLAQFDVSDLTKGIYMVEVLTENQLKMIKKLIVE